MSGARRASELVRHRCNSKAAVGGKWSESSVIVHISHSILLKNRLFGPDEAVHIRHVARLSAPGIGVVRHLTHPGCPLPSLAKPSAHKDPTVWRLAPTGSHCQLPGSVQGHAESRHTIIISHPEVQSPISSCRPLRNIVCSCREEMIKVCGFIFSLLLFLMLLLVGSRALTKGVGISW